MKINIFGASGSGTTTLGIGLSNRLNYTHLDADDYYWEKTDRPFQKKIPIRKRNSRLWNDFESCISTVLSGSMSSWGKHWEGAFDLGVFLLVPPSIRMERLKNREIERYGNLLKTDPITISNSKAFLSWAKKYDDPTFNGKSITLHNQWTELLKCPVVIIGGNISTEEQINRVLPNVLRQSN